MRKIFLLIPVLMFALTIKAADQYPDPSVSNSLSAAVAAVGDGETIYLDDAVPYVNHYASQGGDDYTYLNGGKNITIKAISGKHPVIKYEVPFLVIQAVNAKFIGVKFDGANLTHYDYNFRFYDNAENSLEFEDCEFTNMGKYMVYVSSGKKAASCIFKNCNIHGNTQRIFYNYKATTNKLAFIDTEISNSSHYIVHNCKDDGAAQIDSCIIINSNIHNNSNRGILNEGTIDGLRLKGSTFTNFPSYSIVDNYTNGVINSIQIDGCEFANNSKTVINGEAASHAGECLINNCYFHDNVGCAVYFRKSSAANQQTCDDLRITNSTFANINVSADYYSVIDIRPDVTTMTDAIKVIMDHCTFYNLTTINHDYSAIRPYKLSDVTITNCIFAHPTAEVDVNEGPQNARRATCCYGGTISNCLTWNLMEDASRNAHRQEGGQPVLKNNFTADPLFTDAANGDLTLSTNDWLTMSLSPACGVATDGTDLGDPRWHKASTVPSTDFVTPYEFTGEKAQILGNIWKDANNYLYGDGGNKYGKGSNSQYGTAIWRIQATTACAVQVRLDMDPDAAKSGHIYKVEIFNAQGKSVGEVKENDYSDANTAISLNGSIYLPKAGVYSIILSNSQTYSSAKIKGITLSRMGGAAQNIPATLDVSEAWYSAKGSRAENMISFSSYTDSWVKWSIVVPNSVEQAYAVTLNINNPTEYGHRFYVSVYEEGDEEHAQTIGESSWNKTYDADAPVALSLGNVVLVGGKNYIVKVTNAESGAQPKIVSVDFAYVGGALQTIPATLNVSHAWYSEEGSRADDMISFTSYTDNWAKWNIAVPGTEEQGYTVTLAISNTTEYGHRFYVSVFEKGDEEHAQVVGESDWNNNYDAENPMLLSLGNVLLMGGKNYVVKVTNTAGGSKPKIISVDFTPVYVGGAVQNLPCTMMPVDALRSARAYIDENGEFRFTSDAEHGHVTEEWAKWRMHVAKKGYYKFATSVNSNNGHSYLVTVYNADETVEKGSKAQSGDNIWGAPKTFYTDLILLDIGDYIFKVQNTTSSSNGRIVNVVATYEGGAQVTIPNDDVPLEEGILHEGATRDADGIHFNGHVDAYAEWNIHATEGLYSFAYAVVGSDYGKYNLIIINDKNNTIYDNYIGLSNSGSVSHSNILLEAGDYTIKVANVNSGSVGYITSIAATAPQDMLILDENKTNDGRIAAADYGTTNTRFDLFLKRSFTAGKYYTICIPADSYNDELVNKFGTGYELWRMSSAEQINGEVTLNFEQYDGSNFYVVAGTPYLIKPAVDVENPIFSQKKIWNNSTIHSFGAADFVGTYYKDVIPAGDKNLYLQNNELFYNENNDTPIKGARAWVRLNTVNAVRARIVLGGQVATEISFVNGELINGTVKTIENGQLIIIKNGVRYNVQGQVIRK